MPNNYDGSQVEICATLSKLVYDRDVSKMKTSATALVPGSVAEISSILPGNMRVLSLMTPGDIYFAFRGTNSVAGWGQNAKIWRSRWLNGHVHIGFLGLYLGAGGYISRMCNRPDNIGKNIYFCGHSQGGAIALIAGMTYRARVGARDPEAVYTFGQPRAADAAFCRDIDWRLDARLSRIVNHNDLVPGVPSKRFGYDHNTNLYHYRRVKHTNTVAVYRLNKRSPGQWYWRVSDHDMAKYAGHSRALKHETPRTL